MINAAGAWAPVVAAMAGFHLCAVPVRHQMLVTSPIGAVSADMPIVRVLDAHVYSRPARGGLLFGGFEHDPVSFDPDGLASGMAACPWTRRLWLGWPRASQMCIPVCVTPAWRS